MTNLIYDPILGLVGWEFIKTEEPIIGVPSETKEAIKKILENRSNLMKNIINKMPPNRRVKMQKDFQWQLRKFK